MNRVEIDWEDLGMAFENALSGVEYYLDRETGKVIMISEDVRSELEVETPHPIEDWLEQDVEQAKEALNDTTGRYVQIEHADTHEEYRDMEDYIDTVASQRLRDQLSRAISGAGAFRRFKDTLLEYPQERERWFAYKDVRLKQRMSEWLVGIKVEPANPAQPPTPPVPAPGTRGAHHDVAEPAAERQELIEELTLLLLYLCSWEEPIAGIGNIRKAWKGFTFDALNTLEDRGLIHQSRKARSVTLTEEGLELARDLEKHIRP